MKKIYALCVLFLALACKKDNDETPLLSSEKNILSFTFIVEGTTYTSTISNTAITAQLPKIPILPLLPLPSPSLKGLL